jgi:hypothetical protein
MDIDKYFLNNGFGKYVLKRQEVVKKVVDSIKLQRDVNKYNSPSVYLSGCRGMGKTSDLMLIARELTSTGSEVYFFNTAARIPSDVGIELMELARQNKNKKFVVIVDEVNANPGSPLFTDLLKGTMTNVATIGAAVPRYLPSNLTANFKKVFSTMDLVLKESDEDVRELIDHWKSKEVASDEVIDYVSQCLLAHCGGHVFPVLAFMEHFFHDPNPQAKKVLAGKSEFRRYFLSEEFQRSTVYLEVCERCFYAEPDSVKTMGRVLGGRAENCDIDTLTRLGWWDPDMKFVLSVLLLNATLNLLTEKKSSDKLLYLDINCTSEENLEKVIIEGLSAMESVDFIDIGGDNVWPVLSFNWACTVESRFASPMCTSSFRRSSGLSVLTSM